MPKFYETIEFDLTNHVATIVFNRPVALNSLSSQLIQETTSAVERAKAEGAQALVTTGKGKAFCAGADLSDFSRLGARTPEGGINLREAFELVFTPFSLLFAELDLPHVCGVNGVTAGAGLSIALHADITVAARSAMFRQPFLDINLIPDMGGSWLFPHLAGRARALGAALTGARFSAQQALDWGLIWEVVDDEDLNAQCQKLARRLADLPPEAIRATKKAINSSFQRSLSDQLAYEAEAQCRLSRMSDFNEGVSAFLEKRKPSFKGR